jgi:hypothetical protein
MCVCESECVSIREDEKGDYYESKERESSNLIFFIFKARKNVEQRRKEGGEKGAKQKNVLNIVPKTIFNFLHV